MLGVDLIDPGSKQDAVDMKMKAKISQFVTMHSHEPERFLLCFLTGDKDFMTEIRAAQASGFRTVVIHPGRASRAFIRQAEEFGGLVYDWTTVRVDRRWRSDLNSLRRSQHGSGSAQIVDCSVIAVDRLELPIRPTKISLVEWICSRHQLPCHVPVAAVDGTLV